MKMDLFKNCKAVVSMLLVQAFATGMQLLSKMILNNGTFIFALMTYRHIVAAICVAPFALSFERDATSKLNWRVWIWMFLNALIGITLAMGLYYYGLRGTTATYAVNFLNLVPIVTFILSIILRVETLGLKSIGGQLKTLGALICVAGALTTGLYHGKSFYINSHRVSHSNSPEKKFKTNYAIGTVTLVGSCLSYALWYILQVKLIKVFPMKYWTTLLTCILASVQSMVVGIIIDRRKVVWKLEWDLELLTIVYSGALATAATFCLISFVVTLRGPTYPPMFNPLALIFVAVLEGLILGVAINIGTVLGTIFIIIGLYSFLWGKRKEMKKLPRGHPPASDVELGTIESASSQPIEVIVPNESTVSDTVETTEQSMESEKVKTTEQVSIGNKVASDLSNEIKP